MQLNEKSLSLYLHIPFCRHRCSYCDFNTYTSLDDLKELYAEAMVCELEQVSGSEKRPVHTIFFGGGTPSLMSPDSLRLILDAVHANFLLAEDAEVTMEANPGTVDLAYLTAVSEIGINRISFGVQSVIPNELALLEREHDFGTVVNAMRMARQAGINNLNMDLIYGVPGQTLQTWEESVRTLLDLSPTHLSLYCLTIEPGTPMQRWLNNGRIQLPDPDLAADQYELACQILAEHGYDHYEISNWSLPGKPCEHNLTYWRNGEYLGLGAGAHGHANNIRYHIVKQPRVYIRRLLESEVATEYPLSTAVAESYDQSPKEAMSDTVMTQMRLLDEGLDMAAFTANFGQPIDAVYGQTIAELMDWGLVQKKNGRLLLTQKGWFLSNQVFYRFM